MTSVTSSRRRLGTLIAAGGLLLTTACGTNAAVDDEGGDSGDIPTLTAEDCADPAAAEAEITDTLQFGWSAALSGPLADAVGNVIEGVEARFAVENAAGGVDGVQLEVVTRDDAFNPERAKANGGELIQAEGADVLATFGSGQLDAMADDQNDQCVPLLFAQASVPTYREIADFPWTTEYLPAADVEMQVVVEGLLETYPDGATVALAVNQTESGQGIATGFREAAEGTSLEIIAEEALTDPDAAASTLKASDAQVLVVAGVTTDCLAMSLAIGRVGWAPESVIQPSNCAEGQTLFAPAGAAADGQQILRWLKDPANPAFADDPDVLDYLDQVESEGVADSPQNSYTVNGWAIGDLLIDNLTRAAESDAGLSRLGIMLAAREQDYHPPMFLDGINFTMSPTQAFGILAFQPWTWNATEGYFEQAGDTIDISERYE